jgi:ADP-dependent phosphofructokinase/glucokinase
VFAACAAAARTVSGSLVSLEDVERGLDVPVSERGLKACRELADYLGYAELVETGMAQARGWNVTFVPTKVVEKPVLTVGLGDLISSSSFLLGT